MRTLFSLPILGISLAIATPVFAQDSAPETEMAEKLNDPVFQDNMASMIGGFMTAMMDIPIGQIAASVEQAIPEEMRGRADDGFSRIDPDATIADLASRDDPDFEDNLNRNVRKGTKMMGIMASEFSVLLPQLRAMADKMKDRMDDLE